MSIKRIKEKIAMKILHIAKIAVNKDNGVNVVVPQHIYYQSKYAEVKFINLRNVKIDEIEEFTLPYDSNNILNGLGEFKPDIVIIHEANNIENIKIYRQLKKAGIPYILLPHGEITNEALKKKWLKKKIAYALFFNRFIKNAIAIQCLSEHEAERIKFKAKKFIGTNGIICSNEKKQKFNYDKVIFIYIGRLETYIKGFDMLCEAVAKKSDLIRLYNAEFRIYGPDLLGRKAEIEENIDKFGVNDFVKVLSPVYGEEKKKVLFEGDVFFQTSRTEGMPVGLLEAINCGLPVIFTQGTNLFPYNNYNFGYYAGNSAEGIAQAIENCLNDRENWFEKSDNGIKMTNENFSWDIVAQNTVQKYSELLKNAD